MNKKIYKSFLMMIVFQLVLCNCMLASSNVPIALSVNFGMPSMLGCQSTKAKPKADCHIHKLGISQLSKNNAKILSEASGSYVMNNYGQSLSNKLYYTNFHVNGYFAAVSPAFTVVRFGAHQPFASVQGVTRSGYDCQPYLYTAADYLIFCQNMITEIDFLNLFNKMKSSFSGSKPLDYSSVNKFINTTFANYLMSRLFYNYSCSSGNLLGGSLPFSHTKDAGVTAFQNYVFDECSVYSNSVYSCNNFDITTPSLRVDPKLTLADNSNNKSTELNSLSFTNQITGSKVSCSDYFNGVGSNILLYIPLHFADPGTTYVGTDI